MTKSEAKKLRLILEDELDVRAALGLFLGKKTRRAFKPMKQQRLADKATAERVEQAISAGRRTYVFERAGGVCELSGAPNPTEWHHLRGGHGQRKQRESIQNTMAVTQEAHRAYHRNPAAFAEIVAAWCRKYGYPPINRIQHAALRRSTP